MFYYIMYAWIDLDKTPQPPEPNGFCLVLPSSQNWNACNNFLKEIARRGDFLLAEEVVRGRGVGENVIGFFHCFTRIA